MNTLQKAPRPVVISPHTNPIKKAVHAITGMLKDRELTHERDKLLAQEKELAAKKERLKAVEAERARLVERRVDALSRQSNMANTKAGLLQRLKDSTDKTSAYITGDTIASYEGIGQENFVDKFIEELEYQRQLKSFLTRELVTLESNLQAVLAKVDADIAAFEKKAIA